MRNALGVLFSLAGVVGGAVVAIWVFVIGGISNIINGIKADPTEPGRILWGFIELPLSVLAFWIIAAAGVIVGFKILGRKRPRVFSLPGRKRSSHQF